ncbi:hypothetical protein [Rhizorhabdus wittichii]|uniref:hypothetical protein n=1 Tax=Rhizorhabdus wittichii TaxID=160791 RepID=UPI0002DC014C|nr:hypothetical protein [Rhizorhabdus wittichii]
MRLSIDYGAERQSHSPALLEWIAWYAGLIRSTGAIHLQRPNSLQSNFSAVGAVDRAVDIVKGNRKANK